MSGLLELAARVEAVMGSDNGLDVLVECALFEPDMGHVSVRPNAAGTKVIYSDRDGKDETFWAHDWTVETRRAATAAALRARTAIAKATSLRPVGDA